MDNAAAKRVQTELMAAIRTGNADEFKRLLQQNPAFPPAETWLVPVHTAAATSGLQMFRIFVGHYPQTKSWDLGHLGNPVGLAAAQGDMPYLRFLLDDLGLSASQGRMMRFPARNYSSPE